MKQILSADTDAIIQAAPQIIWVTRLFANEYSCLSFKYSAMTVGGDVDENGKEIPPSKLDYILHFVTFFWKVLFSFIPPW